MRSKGLKAFPIILLAIVLVLAACSGGDSGGTGGTSGGGTSQSGGSGSGGAGEITLGITWWGPDARHEATMKAIEIYTQQNPNVKFKPEYMAWDAFWQKLPTLAASRSVPDVLQMDAAYINEYVANGTLEDLTDIDLSGIVDPNVIENLKIDGKLYGIPLSQNAQGIAFNKAELEAAGAPLPKVNWTWDDYFNWGREVKALLPDGKYGISDTSNLWDWYNWFQTGNGEKPLMSDNGKTFTLNRELFIKYHSTLKQLRDEGIVPPPDQQLAFLENDPTADPMASGVVMTRGATTGSVAALEEMMPGKVDVVNVPIGSAGGGWAQSTIFLSVSSNSAHKEEAKKFVKWFITDKEAGRALGLTRGVPINPEIYAELEPTLEQKDKLGKKIYDVSVEKALPFYSIAAGYTEWVDTYKATMEAVMFDQLSIEEAYERLNALGNEIAASNQ